MLSLHKLVDVVAHDGDVVGHDRLRVAPLAPRSQQQLLRSLTIHTHNMSTRQRQRSTRNASNASFGLARARIGHPSPWRAVACRSPSGSPSGLWPLPLLRQIVGRSVEQRRVGPPVEQPALGSAWSVPPAGLATVRRMPVGSGCAGRRGHGGEPRVSSGMVPGQRDTSLPSDADYRQGRGMGHGASLGGTRIFLSPEQRAHATGRARKAEIVDGASADYTGKGHGLLGGNGLSPRPGERQRQDEAVGPTGTGSAIRQRKPAMPGNNRQQLPTCRQSAESSRTSGLHGATKALFTPLGPGGPIWKGLPDYTPAF